MAYAFLGRIVDNEYAPGGNGAKYRKDTVNKFTTLLQNNDAQHRTFAMTTLIFSANEGLLIICRVSADRLKLIDRFR